MNKKVALIVLAVAVVAAGYFLFAEKRGPAGERVGDATASPPPEPATVSLYGTITEIVGRVLTVEAMSNDPAGGNVVNMYEVDAQTARIVRVVPRTQEEYMQALAEYTELLERFPPDPDHPEDAPAPPAMTTEQTISVSELKVGDTVAVSGEEGDGGAVIATEIRVQ